MAARHGIMSQTHYSEVMHSFKAVTVTWYLSNLQAGKSVEIVVWHQWDTFNFCSWPPNDTQQIMYAFRYNPFQILKHVLSSYILQFHFGQWIGFRSSVFYEWLSYLVQTSRQLTNQKIKNNSSFRESSCGTYLMTDTEVIHFQNCQMQTSVWQNRPQPDHANSVWSTICYFKGCVIYTVLWNYSFIFWPFSN
jgi:hypothetical protein